MSGRSAFPSPAVISLQSPRTRSSTINSETSSQGHSQSRSYSHFVPHLSSHMQNHSQSPLHNHSHFYHSHTNSHSPLYQRPRSRADAPSTNDVDHVTLAEDENHDDAVNGSGIETVAKPVVASALCDPIVDVCDEPGVNKWNRWLVALQIFAGPLFATLILWANLVDELRDPQQSLIHMLVGASLVSLVLLALLLSKTEESQRPKYHYLLCFLGFLISIAWISTIAGEVVGVLKALGIILEASEAILGLTVFAAGNSIGDLVADITVARLGFPVMALSACFGGPMLNILLGIGIGGVWMMISQANRYHKKHPNRPYKYKPFKIRVGGTLLVSAVTLLVTLFALLVFVPTNRWKLTRRLGYALISLWAVSTAVNVAIELTGVWADAEPRWLASGEL